jgi:hypothetical protein
MSAPVESYTFSPSNREDLQDVIFNIDPTETPIVSAMGRGEASNKKHEWLRDSLVTETLNINVEGADYTDIYDTRPDPDRLHNYTQIWSKNLSVTGTQEAIDHAGRKSELAYQMAKMGLEMRRDMEYQFSSGLSSAEVALLVSGTDGGCAPLAPGSSSVARVAGSLDAWIRTNTDTTGTDVTDNGAGQPDDNVETVPGVARAFLESMLKNAIRNAYVAGGNPQHIFVDPFNKQVVSSFTGGTTKFDQSEDKRLVTSIDVYVSDFGEHMVVPDRFIKQNGTTGTDGTSAFILDMTKWSMNYLRPFHQKQLAEIGDAENRVLLAECTLCSKQEAASASVRDLTFA